MRGMPSAPGGTHRNQTGALVTWLNLIAVLCAASAWLVTRRAPQHQPVAVALSICAALDIIRAVLPMPARVDMAVALTTPCVSAWLYWKVIARAPNAWVICGLWFALLGLPFDERATAFWNWVMPVGYVCAALTGIIALWVRSAESMARATWTPREHVALMLLAGDVAGLILLCRREWISYQAGAVLALVTAYQVWWLWRSRDERNRKGG
jgi:hypothetical protein